MSKGFDKLQNARVVTDKPSPIHKELQQGASKLFKQSYEKEKKRFLKF